jgi:hypothetical protein
LTPSISHSNLSSGSFQTTGRGLGGMARGSQLRQSNCTHSQLRLLSRAGLRIGLTGVHLTGVYLLFTSLPSAHGLGGENPYIDTKDVLKPLNCGRLGR